MRSFWRTYNLIWIIFCAAMGVGFIALGFMVPITAMGMWIGAACCFLTAGALLAWHLFSKDLIPDSPMVGPFGGMAAASQASAYSAQFNGTAFGGQAAGPLGAANAWGGGAMNSQMVPGTAVIDRADATGHSGPLGRVVDVHLTVSLPGRNPYQVMVRETVQPQAEPYVVPGATVQLQANSSNPQHVVLQIPR
jgi:hypothetical protein